MRYVQVDEIFSHKKQTKNPKEKKTNKRNVRFRGLIQVPFCISVDTEWHV